MSVTLIVATSNAGKAAEFAAMLRDFSIRVKSLSAYVPLQPPEETGQTFRENACLKASYYATQLRAWALADDSGLEVDALNGKPGVVSARWAELHEAGRGDADNNRLLLRQLEAVPDAQRTGRFVCCLALSDPTGKVMATVEQWMDGHLLREPRGTLGFGYDSLFVAEGQTQSNAEIPSELKHAISHRGKAMRELVKQIKAGSIHLA